MPRWNKALWLVSNSRVTWSSQSDCLNFLKIRLSLISNKTHIFWFQSKYLPIKMKPKSRRTATLRQPPASMTPGKAKLFSLRFCLNWNRPFQLNKIIEFRHKDVILTCSNLASTHLWNRWHSGRFQQ